MSGEEKGALGSGENAQELLNETDPFVEAYGADIHANSVDYQL